MELKYQFQLLLYIHFSWYKQLMFIFIIRLFGLTRQSGIDFLNQEDMIFM